MFASRANQENVVYEQQTAAAAKPLNQGVKGLAPKTPANKAPKTPFKVQLNDENAAFGRNAGGKAKQDGLFGEGKSGKVDRDAFVTPAGPRNRAPLGNKTTNAKATAFQTPAPPTQEKPSAKPSSPRMRRAKIKVHEAETTTHNDIDQEETEIEYMPPREVPLPDYPDDWPHDRTYPQFEGANLTRGWWSEFGPKNDPEELSDFEEKLNQLKERERKEKAQQAKKTTSAKTTALQKTSKDPLTSKVQPLTAKNAASALSGTTKASLPRFAAPTSTSQSRMPSAAALKKSRDAAKMPVAQGNPRHNAARAASNSTLGYSKGRAASSAARKTSVSIDDGQQSAPMQQDVSRTKTPLDDLFAITASLECGDDADDLGGGVDALECDDGLDDFQLPQMDV